VGNCQAVAWLTAAILLTAPSDAPTPIGGDDWKFDILHPKRGKDVKGLVVENAADHVLIRIVTRKAGAPTIVISERFSRDEIDSLDLLEEAERSRLRSRLQALARERSDLVARLHAIEKEHDSSTEVLVLKRTEWPPDARIQAWSYRGSHFQLISTARPEIVRFLATELEQIFCAYARALPPRVDGAEPVTVLLFPSLAEYQTLTRSRGYSLLNPAHYDAGRKQIVCASDLQRLAEENERIHRENDRQRAAIRVSEAELRKAYRERVPKEQLQPLEDTLRQMKAAEERNTAALDHSRQKLCQRLYHEAFHAYVATCVYPPGEKELPLWLNEGLAQIFETAIVEAADLRIGHVSRERYLAVQAALKDGSLLPLAELLKSGPKQFMVAHASDRASSDRYYVSAWAVTFHLVFERHVLQTNQFEEYLVALKRGDEPIAAFERLVGETLSDFEREHRAYLVRLRPD
jgi:hypothetical protein